MSKKNQNAMAKNGAPKAKNTGYRIFAFLLLVVAGLAVSILSFSVIKSAKADGIESLKLLSAAMGMLSSESALEGTMGTVYNLSIYVFALCTCLCGLLSLIAIFAAKKAPALVRTAVCFLACGALVYTVCFAIAFKVYDATAAFNFEPMVALPITLDLFSAAIALVGAILCVVLAAIKAGKIAWLHFVQFLLSAGVVVMVGCAVASGNVLVDEKAESFAKLAMLAGLFVSLINAVISIARMSKKGGIVFDLIRYIVSMAAVVLVVFKAESSMKALIAAGIVLVQILIVIVQLVLANKKEVVEAKEEATQAATTGFHIEEYAEAYAYEGGPVSGVLMAEEVNPTFLPHEPHVTTAGYDFYNSKSFDPFIATLNDEERNAFTEIFILKFKGTMPELPDYEVGGDNKEFFRKIFIYLGQYRDRLPQPLLMKMYQFSMKI